MVMGLADEEGTEDYFHHNRSDNPAGDVTTNEAALKRLEAFVEKRIEGDGGLAQSVAA
jgi:hypothetical protein